MFSMLRKSNKNERALADRGRLFGGAMTGRAKRVVAVIAMVPAIILSWTLFFSPAAQIAAAETIGRVAATEEKRTYLFICNGGQFVERGSTNPTRANFSVSIAFDSSDRTSEVLLGSRSNQTIGRRDAMYFDALFFEDKNIITGAMSDNPDTSDYWSLYIDEKTALISLNDIILRAENCVDMVR